MAVEYNTKAELRLTICDGGMEMTGTDSALCPVTDFGVLCVEPSVSTT